MKNTTHSRAAYSNQEARDQVGNLYLLPLLAAYRAKELKRGHQPMVITKAGRMVTALQEIEAGCFDFKGHNK
jgi:DNA-directed RNA polymerase omega subunit